MLGIAALWREQANRMADEVRDIQANCHGVAKWRARISRLLGVRTCGSAASGAQIVMEKARARSLS